jgi:hypothetical protein
MPKPWGKYEIDYLDHPKFRALHANAIVLWHEAKNYCDKFQTDGRFPKEIVKTFRFSTAKAVEQLERSCGVKPNGDPYAPLWMAQDIGGVAYYVMHDYLDYNDCRDEVLARLADADERAALRRQKNKARQQRFREVRQETLRHADGNADRNAGGNAGGHTVGNALVTPVTRPPTVSVSVPDLSLVKEQLEREKSASLSPPADDPFLNQQTGDRAAAFLDRYEVLYRTHRKGARYARKPVRDYAAAVTLCHTWADDSRLDKLAIIFLTTDHKFADEGSRTVPQFLGLASWCDGKLADWEAKKASA